MGLHRSLVLAVAATLALPTVAANKKGLFGRMTQETVTNGAAADAAANAISSAIGAAADSFSAGGALDKAMEHFSETQWKLAERAFEGDMLGVLRDTMLTNKQHLDEMTEAWSNPKIFKYLYDNTPFFKAIKPIRNLVEERFEGQTGWTTEQGKQAVTAFADVMMKMLDSVESVRDPQRMAEKLTKYAQGADKVFNALKERVESGDKSAEFDMQQHMLNNELGDLIDLKALGFDGTEPPIFQIAREAVKKEEPAIWNSVLSSPLARKYMDDPMLAVKEAVAVTNEYASYWKDKQPINP